MKTDKEEKLEQLSRILRSSAFRGSDSLKTFLKFVVHNALESDSCELKEYTIASEVFGNSNYDSRIDSTVRVQAARVRTKLQEYYGTNGAREDKWIIDLPKGHYVPVFRTRDEATDAPGVEMAQQAAAEKPVALPTPFPERPSRRFNWPALLLGLLSVSAIVAALNYRAETIRLQPWWIPAYFAGADLETLSILWKDYLHRGRPVVIVYNSMGTRPIQTSDQRREVLRGGRAQDRSNPSIEESGLLENYTGAGEVMGVASLSRLFTRLGKGFRVKRSVTVDGDDLKTENMVILGSPREHSLLDTLPKLGVFAFDLDPQSQMFSIINSKPNPGERERYSVKVVRQGGKGPVTIEDYALVSLLHGPGENNHLLTLAGITTFATQAAAEYVTSPATVRDLTDRLKGDSGSVPASFEVLLQVQVTDGVPVQTSYLTHHVIMP